MPEDGQLLLNAVIRVCGTFPELSSRDRLDVLQIAWLAIASNARTEALIAPGGFPEEQNRQVKQLRKMAEIVAADRPDLEMERLFQDGDIDGMLQHLQRRLSDAEKDDD